MSPASVFVAETGLAYSRTSGPGAPYRPGRLARRTACAVRRERRRSGVVSAIGEARRFGRLELPWRGS
jgi:hypothetical protein